MARRWWAGLGYAALSACAALGQSRYLDVDIHASGPNTIAGMRVRVVQGRYELRNATLVDLIRTAWNVDADNVVGGPDWLDDDRFDVIATVSPNASAEALRDSLQGILRERFQVAVHNGTRDEPAYEITAGKKSCARRTHRTARAAGKAPAPTARIRG